MLEPKVAAMLAKEVYSVNSEFALQAFLGLSEFSNSSEDKQTFDATVGSRLINTQDGFGVAARGGGKHADDLFIMFRGSTTRNKGADWVSNFRCGVESSTCGPVHIGFHNIFNSIRPEINGFLTKQLNGKRAVHTIHCIGHSLGGAVATIAAAWIFHTTGKRPHLYTFGSPKPGMGMYSANVTLNLGEKNIHRMYHTTDPVPMVPLYPFTHPPMPGFGHPIGSTESILSASAHSMEKYAISASQFNTYNNVPSGPMRSSSEIEKWLESDDISLNPFSVSTWRWINDALEYVLKRILKGTLAAVQMAVSGAMYLADRIAWILHNGIHEAMGNEKWVFLLIRKMMKMLNMRVVEKIEELTRSLMTVVLERLMHKISNEAQKAIQQIDRK